MSNEAALAGEALVTSITVTSRGDIVLRACCWNIDRNRVVRLLLLGFFQRVVGFLQRVVIFFQRVVGFFPRVIGRVDNRRMGDVVAVA
jgi:hypothetical protein